jgi:endogenous inhibitor of DNA gyrase (YacG/DUF329 family)
MSKANKFMSDQCRLKKIPDWIKQQKKIAKKTKEKDTIITMKC